MKSCRMKKRRCNFNSIKVQLERNLTSILCYIDADFNSIKVQLEPSVSKSFFSPLHFNSIKVQLERALPSSRGAPLSFQFHKGTIRTKCQTLLRWHSLNFNSIKVQLEHDKSIALQSLCHYFNSIKVQLELYLQLTEHLVVIFQFHKGTIRTFHILDELSFVELFQFHKGTIRTI